MRNDTEVVGMKHGYSSLADFSSHQPLVEGKDYITKDGDIYHFRFNV